MTTHATYDAVVNLRTHQKRLDCYPPCVVQIRCFDKPDFRLDIGLHRTGTKTDSVLTCHLSAELLSRILHREEHWNNAELGCHIEFDRLGPYNPDVHTLLSFFHLPRPTP